MKKPERYTVVPISEYKDNSCRNKTSLETIFNTIFALQDMKIGLSVPVKESTGRDGFKTTTMQGLVWGRGSEIVKMEDGNLAVKVVVYKDPHDKESKTRTVFLDYPQEYFPRFIMPFFKYVKEIVISADLKAFFQKEYFKEATFSKMVTDCRQIFEQKNIALKEQKFEEAAELRDKEKVLIKKIKNRILPKIEEFKKGNPDYFEYDLIKIIKELLPTSS